MHRDAIFKFARFATSTSGEAKRTLANYVADLRPNQTAIYYHTGEDAKRIAAAVPDATVEALPGLGHLAHEEKPETVARLIFAAAEAGDRFARGLVDEQADWLGRGIVNLLHLFSPELIVLGGGISNGFALLRGGIAARIEADAMPAFRDVRIERAALGENSGLVGAAVLAFDAASSGGATHA